MSIEPLDLKIEKLKKLRKVLLAKQEKGGNASALKRWQKGLRKARLAQKLTLQDLAAIIRIPKETLHKWERGKSLITLKRALQISKVLNYPLNVG